MELDSGSVRYRSLIIGILAGLSFSTASIIIRLLSLNVESIVTYRLLLGGGVLFIILKPDFRALRQQYKSLVAMGTALFLHFYFFVRSVKDTFILNSTLLVNTTPIISIVILALMRLENVSGREIIAVFFGFLGITIISLTGKMGGFGRIGDAEALVAAFMISIYSIIGRLKLGKTGGSERMASLIYLIAGMESLLVNMSQGLIEFNMDLRNFILILMLAFIPTAFGHTAFLKSLEGLKPHESQLLAMLEPLGATLLALFLFSEIPPTNSIVGAILLLMAIYLVSARRG